MYIIKGGRVFWDTDFWSLFADGSLIGIGGLIALATMIVTLLIIGAGDLIKRDFDLSVRLSFTTMLTFLIWVVAVEISHKIDGLILALNSSH